MIVYRTIIKLFFKKANMHKLSRNTVQAVSNGTELACSIVQNILGDEAANTLGGSLITKQTLTQLISLRMQAKFTKYTRGNK